MPPLDPLLFFTPDDLARGLLHARVNFWTGAIELALDIALLLFVAFSRRFGDRIVNPSRRVSALEKTLGKDWRRSALFIMVVALSRQALSLPFGIVRECSAQTLGLSHEPALSWMRRFLVDTTLSTFGLALAGVMIIAIRRRFPKRWWLAVGLTGAFALVGDAMLEPYLTRLDFTETPLEKGHLHDRLTTLAQTEKQPSVFTVIDASRYGTRANAFVTGFGPSRRIVLTDTLLQLGDEAAVGAVAHEIGHRRAERMPGRLFLASGGLLVFLFFTDRVFHFARKRGAPTDAHAFAFLLVAVTMLKIASLPVRAALGREEEREADALELSVRQDLDAYIANHVSIVRANALDPAPGPLTRLLSDHPSPMERIRRAYEMRLAREP